MRREKKVLRRSVEDWLEEDNEKNNIQITETLIPTVEPTKQEPVESAMEMKQENKEENICEMQIKKEMELVENKENKQVPPKNPILEENKNVFIEPTWDKKRFTKNFSHVISEEPTQRSNNCSPVQKNPERFENKEVNDQEEKKVRVKKKKRSTSFGNFKGNMSIVFKPRKSGTFCSEKQIKISSKGMNNKKINVLCSLMKQNVDIKERRIISNIKHAHTFVGSHALDWLVSQLKIEREEAKEIAEKMMKANLFFEVHLSDKFVDDRIGLYRFKEDFSLLDKEENEYRHLMKFSVEKGISFDEKMLMMEGFPRNSFRKFLETEFSESEFDFCTTVEDWKSKFRVFVEKHKKNRISASNSSF